MEELCNTYVTGGSRKEGINDNDFNQILPNAELEKLVENETKLIILEYFSSSFPETDPIEGNSSENLTGSGESLEDHTLTESLEEKYVIEPKSKKKGRDLDRSNSYYISYEDFVERRERIKKWHIRKKQRSEKVEDVASYIKKKHDYENENFVPVKETVKKYQRKTASKKLRSKRRCTVDVLNVSESSVNKDEEPINEDREQINGEVQKTQSELLNGKHSYLSHENFVSVKERTRSFTNDHKILSQSLSAGVEPSGYNENDGNSSNLLNTRPGEQFNESKRKLEDFFSGKGKKSKTSIPSSLSKRKGIAKPTNDIDSFDSSFEAEIGGDDLESCSLCNGSYDGEEHPNSKVLKRQDSYISYERFQARREKVKQMQIPIRKYIDNELKKEITNFDNKTLKLSPTKYSKEVINENSESYQNFCAAKEKVRQMHTREKNKNTGVPCCSKKNESSNRKDKGDKEDKILYETFVTKREKVKQLFSGRKHSLLSERKRKQVELDGTISKDKFLENRDKIKNLFMKHTYRHAPSPKYTDEDPIIQGLEDLEEAEDDEENSGESGRPIPILDGSLPLKGDTSPCVTPLR